MSLDKLLKQNLEFLDKIRGESPLDAFDVKDSAFAETERQRRIKTGEANIEALSRRRDEVLQSFDAAVKAERAEIDRLQNVKPVVVDKEPKGKSDVKSRAVSKKPK